MTTDATKRYGHAVVLGASMAGLAAAQALTGHFERVTVVERDALVDRPELRAGVPQAQHLHVLLHGGARALESLLPGYAEGLFAAGAVPVDLPAGMLWLNPAGWIGSTRPWYPMLCASRSLIEWYTRRRVMATAGVRIIDRCNAVDIRLSDDRRRVTGICVSRTGADGPASVAVDGIDADLLVDATGRRSRLSDWLERRGFDRPAETRIDPHLSYATRIYRRPPDPPWPAVFLQARPPDVARMGIMFPIEEDRWMVTLQGAGADRPPTFDDGFIAFAASLRSTAIHDAIRDAEPLSEAVGWANTANLRRHFERARLPDRLLVVGDGVCAFNPVYGTGMTVAAQTAVALGAELERHSAARSSLDGFTVRMQRAVAKIGEPAWMVATGDDLRFPGTTGAQPSRLTRLQHRYLDRVLAAATVDETVLAALLQVFMLLAPPTVLFRPGIVSRALRHGGSPNTEPPAPLSTAPRAIPATPRVAPPAPALVP